jgi:outer membrane protein assembly factor BamB
MIRKLLKWCGAGLAVAVLVGVVLYLLGLRPVMYGGGNIRAEFVTSASTRADTVARHRAEQRAAGAPSAETTPAAAATVRPSGDVPAAEAPARPPASAPAPYWIGFRGPDLGGRYDEQPIRTMWPASGLTPIWKQPVGEGYASFSIGGGRAYTIEQRGPLEVVAAYDVDTGREQWAATWDARFSETLGGDGPRATPAWHDGVVFALGAAGELRALDDRTGRTLWRTNILQDSQATNLQWGMAASPLVVDDLVVVLPGGGHGQSVAAYDRRTGSRRWTALDDQQSYASPMLATLAGRRQIVVLSASRVMGLSPDRGDLLWQHPWTATVPFLAAQPVIVSGTRVFLSSADGAAVVEIDESDGRFSAREVWRTNRMKNDFAGSVLHDGHLYGLDKSILACLDAATGDLKWKGGRYGFGQLVLASGHLIVLTEDGQLALVRATPERHDEIARFVAVEGKTWNYPALAGGRLLVRNLQEMAAFDLRPAR